MPNAPIWTRSAILLLIAVGVPRNAFAEDKWSLKQIDLEQDASNGATPLIKVCGGTLIATLQGAAFLNPRCFQLPTVIREDAIHAEDRRVVLELLAPLESRIRELELEVEQLRARERVSELKGE